MTTKTFRPLRYVRKNFDWETYIEEHYKVKYAGNNELRICCPSCDDTKFKCYVNTDKKVFHCFKCSFTTRGGQKDVFDFVALTESIPRGRAMMRLVQEYTPVTPDELDDAIAGTLDEVPEQPKKFFHTALDTLPEVAIPIQNGGEDAAPFWRYLRSRGLTDTEITTVLQTHYVPNDSYIIRDNFGREKCDIGRRLLWPLYGGDHQLVSWQARVFERQDAVKYVNAPNTDISATLWPYVPPKPGSTVILCEGLLDCVALRRLPHSNFSAYATFTKYISDKQIALLRSWGVEALILFWDQDAKAQVTKLAKQLNLHFEVYVPCFTGWDCNTDAGDCLLLDDGVALLTSAVENAIHTNSIDFLSWELS